jgi:ribosome maturation factor RimP
MAEGGGAGDRVAALAEAAAREVGVEVLRTRLRTAGPGPHHLVVTIDRADGVDIDAVANMSHALERLLDEEDPIVGAYVLEVESPGERRPLRLPDDVPRFVGQRVRLILKTGGRQAVRLTGTLVDADEWTVRLRSGDGAEGVQAVPLEAIEEACLAPEATGPGGRGGAKGRRR